MDIGGIIIGISVLFAVLAGFALFSKYLRGVEKQQKLMGTKQEIEIALREQELASIEESKKVQRDPGGYIIVDLPEEQRTVFCDLLKGFEEYAQLRGYQVFFSFDSSIPYKIAFKFTIGGGGISVSKAQVQKDFEEYIKSVQNGDILDGLPVVLNREQHDMLLTILRNRINFLTHNHKLNNNTIQYYERLLDRGSVARGMFETTPTVVVQTGGNMDTRKYSAAGSPQAIQGDANRDLLLEADNSVRIENSFNQRNNQVEALSKLIESLKVENSQPKEIIESAVRSLENVKDEISEEEQPDRSRIRKWLTRAKDTLQTLSLSKETTEALKDAYEKFNVTDLIKGLF